MDNPEANKARQKESFHRRLYSSVLRSNQDVFQEPSASSSNNDVFEDEKKLLGKVFQTEIRNLGFGIVCGLGVFAALRFGPKYVINRFGGEQRSRALKEAEANAKQRGTDGIQKSVFFLVEGSFSAWVGYRGYSLASHQSKGSYETISEIPLCKGRSRMAEALCPDWVDVTKNQIPASFWKALDNGDLRDQRTWTAIRQFSLNCEKRLSLQNNETRGESSRAVPISEARFDQQ